MLTKYDRLLIYFLLLVSLLTLLASTYWAKSFGTEAEKVVVATGENRQEYLLDARETKRFEVRGCEIEIRARRVRVHSSSCPRNICVLRGWVDEEGEAIVCLPHEVIITITGRKESAYDSVVR